MNQSEANALPVGWYSSINLWQTLIRNFTNLHKSSAVITCWGYCNWWINRTLAAATRTDWHRHWRLHSTWLWHHHTVACIHHVILSTTWIDHWIHTSHTSSVIWHCSWVVHAWWDWKLVFFWKIKILLVVLYALRLCQYWRKCLNSSFNVSNVFFSFTINKYCIILICGMA